MTADATSGAAGGGGYVTARLSAVPDTTLLERAVESAIASLRGGIDPLEVATALEVRLARHVSVCRCGHDWHRHQDATIAPECLDCDCLAPDVVSRPGQPGAPR